jgi:hypothetical protein
VFALRFFAQPAAFAPTADAPPAAAEDRVAADDDRSDDGGDDPSDVDDDDDNDDDDVALPAAIVSAVPSVATLEPAWAILRLADLDLCDPFFRPPRHA